MIIKLFETFVNTIKIGDVNDKIKDLQTSLIKMGFELSRYGIDSKFGNETLSTVKSFYNVIKNIPTLTKFYKNIDNTLTNDDVDTIIEISNDKKYINDIKKYFTNLESKIKNVDLIGKDIILKNISEPEKFIEKLLNISTKLKINPNWLITVFYKESGIDPKAVNPTGGASGLIQFMPKTAKYLGTSVENIRNMSAIEQLDYVYKYYEPYKGKINEYADLYTVTFYPYMLGKNGDYIVGSEKNDRYAKKVAKQNKVIDVNKDGYISYNDFKQYVYNNLPKNWNEKLRLIV